ncbi:hypothetical protein P167DRAFT_576010 [Morchella conica CCBAS932]|uniref:Uncharacterized protein n=1 Tax=Morchella conica CCBAS932 TaxID=1392247 RepID=A0A3N4KMY1_9PEZI|nr:hypothetical protein P167DRAFT_576010 [Morchella conica CCBAS932]
MVSEIKPKPLISSLGLAKDSTRLKRKAHTEVKKEEPTLLGASSDSSRSVSANPKDANQTLTTVGVRRVLDSDDESPTATTIKEVKKTSVRKYTRKTKNLGGEKGKSSPPKRPAPDRDKDFKQTTQPKQPPKTATTQREGVRKTSDAVTSVTGDGPSQRTPMPRTKSAAYPREHPLPTHSAADAAATQTPLCSDHTPNVIAPRPTADAATGPAPSTVIYVDGNPFIMPTDTVECFLAVEQEVSRSYHAVYVRKLYKKRDRALASPVCDVSEFWHRIGSDFEAEVPRLVWVLGDGAGRRAGARGDGGGGGGSKEVNGKEEDYPAPKD